MKLDEILPLIGQVSIELSNLCDLSACHEECPLHITSGKTIVLPSDVIYDLYDELRDMGYSGALHFSRYNEPLIDPRLYRLIEWARRMLPESEVRLTTNGRFLTSETLGELETLGVGLVHVSLYGNTLEQRRRHDEITDLASGRKMTVQAPLPRGGHYHKALIDIYRREPVAETTGCVPCYQPYSDLVINCHGDVTLCCLDWQNRHIFGRVSATPLRKIVQSPAMQGVYETLSQGTRTYDICTRCRSARGKPS